MGHRIRNASTVIARRLRQHRRPQIASVPAARLQGGCEERAQKARSWCSEFTGKAAAEQAIVRDWKQQWERARDSARSQRTHRTEEPVDRDPVFDVELAAPFRITRQQEEPKA
jgi:hypothetical protein